MIAPNRGEVFRLGEFVILKWSAVGDHGVTGVDLYVSTTGSGGPYSSVQLGYQNSGEAGWQATTVSDQCYFKVVAHGGDGLTGEDVNDAAFTVTDATATELALFEAGWQREGVEIRWRFAKPSDVTAAVERAADEAGPWVALAGAPLLADARVDGPRRPHGIARCRAVLPTGRDGAGRRDSPLRPHQRSGGGVGRGSRAGLHDRRAEPDSRRTTHPDSPWRARDASGSR